MSARNKIGAARVGVYSAAAGVATVAIGCMLAAAGWLPLPPGGGTRAPAGAMAPAAPRPAAPPVAATMPDPALQRLRARVHWVRVRVGRRFMLTPDRRSRLMLVRAAARHARLDQVGLTPDDVYGLITAETSWLPRTGAGRDGRPSMGIAQFEAATARAVGLRDPLDPVAAVFAAADQMRDAALWSASRLRGLQLDAGQRADKLREGVSIYYNLSSRGRAAWNGLNTDRLPRATQRHIVNARAGAQEAAAIEARLRARGLGASGAVPASGDPAGGG